MPNTHYDIIMAGGGAASRILLHFLKAQPGFDDLRILVLEAENKIAEKTWCFWTQGTHPFEHLISKQWQTLAFKSESLNRTEIIDPYRYCCIRGNDFDAYFNHVFLPAAPNISFQAEKIISVAQTAEQWQVTTTIGVYSCHKLVSNTPKQQEEKLLFQHFHGWFIEYDEAKFDPNMAMLMDFSNASNGQFCFFYVLPFSATHALVECTYYSDQAFESQQYEQAITDYLQTNYQGKYRIVQKEQGAIPLYETDAAMQHPAAMVAIGQSAGMIKPSTGYAFERMVEDSKLLAASLMSATTKRRMRHSRFQFYDRLLLSIIRQEPQKAVAIFEQLFKKSSIKSILKFLDENSTIAEELKIFARLPWWPFLKRIKFRS
jgi:lycopene beta-cyclase